MKAQKKIEIVTGSMNTNKVVELLEKHQVEGYTIIPKVVGLGKRGVQDGEGLHDAFNNSYILVACEEEMVEKINEPLSKLLKKYGGICLVSDTMWLVH